MDDTIHVFGFLSVASLLTMIVIDYFFGAKAESIDGWSGIERLLGRPPSGWDSAVFLRLGAVGEVVCGGLINLLVGGVLTIFFRLLMRG